jgi:hypothetical protein
MDWKEATGDDTLLDLVREVREKGERRVSGDLKVRVRDDGK